MSAADASFRGTNAAQLRVLVIGSVGPNQDRLLALARHVSSLVYAYTEFHPNLIRLEPQIPCIAIARRNLVPQVEFLVARYSIDVIYSLLNASDESTEVTLELLDSSLNTPIVRHYKEHPCVATREEKRVLCETDGQIYINEESYDYFAATYHVAPSSAHILDADMISEKYMSNDLVAKKHVGDNQPHLLVAGGMTMLNDRLDVRELCQTMNLRKVHVHLYGYMACEQDGRLIVGDAATTRCYEELQTSCPYVHLHQYIPPDQFARTWSQYDAGFMHPRVSPSDRGARFEELNLPYRYSAYLAAALPLAVPDEGQRAMKRFVQEQHVGFVYSDYEELSEILHDYAHLDSMSSAISKRRKEYSFDAAAGRLAAILAQYAR